MSSVATLFGVDGQVLESAAAAMSDNRGGRATVGGGFPLGLTMRDLD